VEIGFKFKESSTTMKLTHRIVVTIRYADFSIPTASLRSAAGSRKEQESQVLDSLRSVLKHGRRFATAV
jgi:hypothetical protein